MKKTRGTTLVAVKVDELFLSTYEKMSASFEHTLQNTIDTLETKIAEIKGMNMAKQPTTGMGAASAFQ